MNCPKCGLKASADQKFCRVCGASLQLTTQPLAEQIVAPDPHDARVVSSYEARQRASRIVLWGFLMMFIGVAIGGTGKMIMHNEIVTMVGVLVSLAGMFLTAYPYVTPAPRKRPESGPTSQPEILTPAHPAKRLPAADNTEFLPSVTERTTNLLEHSTPERPKQKDDKELSA